MQENTKKKKFRWPPLGMRIIKTGICVFFCLVLNYLFSPQVALISSLAAIVAMQSSLQNTLKTGISRMIGTAIGGGAALAMLPMADNIEIEWLYIIIMPLGMIFIIYLCVLIGVPQSASICAFVYIAVLIVPFNPNSRGNAYMQGIIRIADTAVGVLIALLVNRFISPPKPKPVTSVHVSSNTFSDVYNRVHDELTGLEELILIDTGILDPDVPRDYPDLISSGVPIRAATEGVRVPVPTEFNHSSYVDAAYISRDYHVSPLYLRQQDGYIELPAETYPVTVAWHVDQPTEHETYGLFRGAHKFHELRKAEKQFGRKLRPRQPGGMRLRHLAAAEARRREEKRRKKSSPDQQSSAPRP
ncbi:MAG: hypothetical protein HDQ87_11755 [Clostridia bacterium]|nr:hypothetical protein [Clostridia bacterium]